MKQDDIRKTISQLKQLIEVLESLLEPKYIEQTPDNDNEV